MNQKVFSIAMASDEAYAFPTFVAINSIFFTKHPESEIQIYLIASKRTKESLSPLLRKLSSHYGAREVIILTPPQKYATVSSRISHITTPTYYRLALPELLPEIDQCLYLDGDIVVRQDLSGLFNVPMDDDLIAGVKAAGYYFPVSEQSKKAYCLGIDKFDSYVNGGVLLMNLKLMRELDVSKIFDELLTKNFDSQDQDILNSACYGRIKILPPSMNLMTKYHPTATDSFEQIPALKLCWSKDEWHTACSSPMIVHYADAIKPWRDTSVDFADLWWRCANAAGAIVDMQAAVEMMYQNAKIFQKMRGACEEQQAIISELRDSATLQEREFLWQQEELNKVRTDLAEEKNKLNNTRESLKQCIKGKECLQRRIDDLKSSNSYKAGLAITALPRAVKRMIAKLSKMKTGNSSNR